MGERGFQHPALEHLGLEQRVVTSAWQPSPMAQSFLCADLLSGRAKLCRSALDGTFERCLGRFLWHCPTELFPLVIYATQPPSEVL